MAAGTAIASEIRKRWQPRPVVILAGPGNNGGDGFVVARLLADDGWPVRVALLGEAENLKGDTADNAERWQGGIEALGPGILDNGPLAVDALFGAGLTRPLEGAALEIVQALNERKLDCVAIDIPSGVDGDSGEILAAAPRAVVTVTYFRPKPGHFLMPGRELTGSLVVAPMACLSISSRQPM